MSTRRIDKSLSITAQVARRPSFQLRGHDDSDSLLRVRLRVRSRRARSRSGGAGLTDRDRGRGRQVVTEEAGPRGRVGWPRVVVARRRGWRRWMVHVGMSVGMRVEQEGWSVGTGMGRRRGHRGAVHVQAGILFLPLGASVLEPDLHLGLRQGQRQGQVEPLADREVASGLELVLQGDELLVGEGRAGPSRLAPATAAAAVGGARRAGLTSSGRADFLVVVVVRAAISAAVRGCRGVAVVDEARAVVLVVVRTHVDVNVVVVVHVVQGIVVHVHAIGADGFVLLTTRELAPRIAI